MTALSSESPSVGFLIRLLRIGLCLLLLLVPLAARCESEEALSFCYTGRPAKGESVPVYAEADRRSEQLLLMDAGGACRILGEENSFYKICFNGQIGYVFRKEILAAVEKPVSPLPERICDTVSLAEPATARNDIHLILQGELTAEQPLDALLFLIWDERQFEVEWFRLLTLKEPSFAVSMDQYPRLIPLKEMAGVR